MTHQPPMTRGRLRRLSRIVAVASIATVALAACSGGPSSSDGGSGAQRLRVGAAVFPSSLDPALGTGGSDHMVLYLAFDRLVDADPKTGDLGPGLATSWAWTDKTNTTLELTLRQGVKFQDNTPLDADAVVTSLKHYKEAGVNTELSEVVDIKANGDDKVDIALKSADASLPAVLSDRPGMIVSPTALEKYGKDFPNHPVGAGPYKIGKIVSGSRVSYDRFDGYWGKKAPLAGIDWQTFPEAVAVENAAKSGQLDIAVQIPEADIKAFSGNSKLEVEVGPSYGYTDIVLNGAKAPFNSPDVRKAMNMAVNREDVLEAVNNGDGEVATQPYPKGNEYWSKDAADAAKFDPAAAKALVQEASPDETTFTCNYFPGRGVDVAGPLIAENFKKIGLTMKLRKESLAQALGDFREGRSPCLFTSWTGRPDPSLTLALNFLKTGSSNVGKVDLGADAMIGQLRSTTDESTRQGLVRDIVAQVAQAGPTQIALLRQQSVVLVGRDVHGFVENISGKPDLRLVSLK